MDSRHDDDDDEYLPPPSGRSSAKRTSRSASSRPRRGAAAPAPTGFGVPEMLDNLDAPAKRQARRPASPGLGNPAMLRLLDDDAPARSNRDDYDAGRLTPPLDAEDDPADDAERPKRALRDDEGDADDEAAAAAAARRYRMTRDVSGSESPRSDGEASEVELPSKRKKGKKGAPPPPMPTEPVVRHSAASTRKAIKEFIDRNRAIEGKGKRGVDDKAIKVEVSGRWYLVTPMGHTKDAQGVGLRRPDDRPRHQRDGNGRAYSDIAKNLDSACARLGVAATDLNRCIALLLNDQRTSLAQLQASVPRLDAPTHAVMCELATVLMIDSARAGHAQQLIHAVALGPGTFCARFGDGTKTKPTYVGAYKRELHAVGGSQMLQTHTKEVHDANLAARDAGAAAPAPPRAYVAKPVADAAGDEPESDELVIECDADDDAAGGPASSGE